MNGKRARAIRHLESDFRIAGRLGQKRRLPEIYRALLAARAGGPGWRARAEVSTVHLELVGDATRAARALAVAQEAR